MEKRSFFYLWSGQAMANAGDVFYVIGIISLLYSTTGSATLTALVPFIITFSRFFGGAVAPWIINQISLKAILVLSQTTKTIFLILLYMLIVLLDLNAYFLFPIMAFISFFDGWATPARNALITNLISRENLMRVNGYISTLDEVINLGAWPMGAIFVSMFGGGFPLTITLILFCLASIFMFLLPDAEFKGKLTEKRHSLNSLKEAWVVIWKIPTLRAVAFVDFLDSLASVVWIAAILYIYVDEILNKSEAWWGYINTAFFAGLIMGGLLCIKTERALKAYTHATVTLSSFMIAVLTFTFGFTSVGWIALSISFIVGIATQLKSITFITIVQTETPRPMLPKVLSARDSLLTGAFGLSSLLVGVLVDHFEVQVAFIISSLLLALSGGIALVANKSLRLS